MESKVTKKQILLGVLFIYFWTVCCISFTLYLRKRRIWYELRKRRIWYEIREESKEICLPTDVKLEVEELIQRKPFFLGKKYDVIGKGTFGYILLVKDKDTQTVYKIYKNNGFCSDLELDFLQRNYSPFFITYLSHSKKEKWIEMEYLQGKNLFHYKVWIDEKILKAHLRQVILAVYVLHRKGFIHGDLKPNNIMKVIPFSKNPNDCQVKLIDFDAIEEIGKSKKKIIAPKFFAIPFLYRIAFEGETPEENLLVHSYEDWWSVGVIIWGLNLMNREIGFDSNNFCYGKKLEDGTFDGNYHYPWNFPKKLCSFIDIFLKVDKTKEDLDERIQEIIEHPYFACLPKIENYLQKENSGKRETIEYLEQWNMRQRSISV